MKKLSLTLILIIISILVSCDNNNLKFEQVKGPANNEPAKKEQKTSYYKENSPIKLPQNKEKNSDYIIPNSDKNKITTNMLDKLTKSDIILARNEIYARHGYIFKSKKYKKYFQKQNWYKTNPNFFEQNFNKIESNNLKIIDNYINSIENFTKLITNNYGKYDLNSDGIIEEISVEFKDGGMTYELIIDTITDIQTGGSSFKNMILYDININDEFKEIAIVDKVDNVTRFHYYDGNNIIHMGTIPGTNESIKINGTGQILTKKKGTILGLNNWNYQIEYILTEKRALTKNPVVKYYEMDYEVILKEDITLYESPINNSKLTTLKKGELIYLTRSDDIEWCEIKTSNNLKGWLKIENTTQINKKLVSDVFEGFDTQETLQ